MKREREERMVQKQQLKERFDSEYDGTQEEKDADYFGRLKEEYEKRAEQMKIEFEGMDKETRIQLEGFQVGHYVRLLIEGIPHEFVKYFDPHNPILIGALHSAEENFGFIQVLSFYFYNFNLHF